MDAEGWLDGAITHDGGRWYGVELVTDSPPWPRAELSLQTAPEQLDTAAVLGFFLYRDDRSELDVELGRWSVPEAAPGQFALHSPGGDWLERFERGATGEGTRHTIDWRRGSLAFDSCDASNRCTHWSAPANAAPPWQGHRLHLNLWLHHGDEPVGDGLIEVVLEGVGLSGGR